MKVSEIIKNEQYFTKDTYNHYLRGVNAYRRGDYLAASVESSVFIEALLKDILKALGIFQDGDNLNGRIDRLRGCLKDKKDKKDQTEQTEQAEQIKPDISEADKNLYTDIVFRCNDIRNKRNRIIHDNGVERGDIIADTQDIYGNSLKYLIKDYTQTEVGKKTAEENNRKSQENKPEISEPFPIFISTITPHTFEQEMFIEYFCKRLQEIGAEPRRCIMTDYDMEDPITTVRNFIDECKAVVILGLNRTHSYHYVEKEGANVKGDDGKPIKAKEGNHRYSTSAWLQLEGGIAAGLGKEIFVLCQKSLASEGIFDRGCYSYRPIEMSGPLDVTNGKVDQVIRKIQEYMKSYPQK